MSIELFCKTKAGDEYSRYEQTGDDYFIDYPLVGDHYDTDAYYEEPEEYDFCDCDTCLNYQRDVTQIKNHQARM